MSGGFASVHSPYAIVNGMKILVIDVGGTHVKVHRPGHCQRRRHANALVHVTGHPGPLFDMYDPDHSPVFIIETIDKLAPT
jgi:hypothetical protein